MSSLCVHRDESAYRRVSKSAQSNRATYATSNNAGAVDHSVHVATHDAICACNGVPWTPAFEDAMLTGKVLANNEPVLPRSAWHASHRNFYAAKPEIKAVVTRSERLGMKDRATVNARVAQLLNKTMNTAPLE